MGDVMLYGVLRMPFDMAMSDYLSQRQFYDRVQEAARRLEAAEARLAEIDAATPPSPSTAPEELRNVFDLAWKQALDDAAFYVAGHCADGEHHVEHIRELVPPKLRVRGVEIASRPAEVDDEGLPPLPDHIEVGGEGWDIEDFKSEKTFTVDHLWQYARYAVVADRAQRGDGWISVDDRMPGKERCLAAYVNAAGKHRIIRAMYAGQFQIDAGEDAIDQGNCEYNETDDTFYLKAGWLECIDNWDDYSSIYVTEGTVTHWRRLPASPSHTTNKEK